VAHALFGTGVLTCIFRKSAGISFGLVSFLGGSLQKTWHMTQKDGSKTAKND